jgi:hypothetical protein
VLGEAAADPADSALEHGRMLHGMVSWDVALDGVMGYVHGMCCDVAWDVSWDVLWNVSWNVLWNVAWDVLWNVAWDVSWDVLWNVAWDVSWTCRHFAWAMRCGVICALL